MVSRPLVFVRLKGRQLSCSINDAPLTSDVVNVRTTLLLLNCNPSVSFMSRLRNPSPGDHLDFICILLSFVKFMGSVCDHYYFAPDDTRLRLCCRRQKYGLEGPIVQNPASQALAVK